MRLGTVFALVAVVALLPPLSACGKSDAPAGNAELVNREEAETGARLTVETPAGSTSPIRLTQLALDAQASRVRAPFLLQPGDDWQVFSGEMTAAGRSTTITPGDGPAFIQIPVSFSATDYNVVRLSMRMDAGTACLLKWRGNLQPEFARTPGVSLPTIADNEFRTYIFELDTLAPDLWMGKLERLEFWPSLDQPANVEIGAIELDYEPPAGPRHITMGRETLPALPAQQDTIAWTVDVPEDSLFNVSFGMPPRSWESEETDGARFTVSVEPAEGTSAVLLEQTLRPGDNPEDRRWQAAQADLSEYAGQTVKLLLHLDHLATDQGDLAFWGAPTVIERASEAKIAPVILISLDTLRAGHLSCYGYERRTSPNLDAWAAQDAVLFENAFVQETWTLPSHMTMFTGLYPKNHGVSSNANLAQDKTTITELLRDAGYVSAGFTGMDWWLMPWRGFGQGFDYYSVPQRAFRHIHQTMDLVYPWLDAHPVPKWFLFLHSFDIHSKTYDLNYRLPYDPDVEGFDAFSREIAEPPSFDRPGIQTDATHFLMAANEGRLIVQPDELAYMIAKYDDCILMTDAALQAFFNDLKARNAYDNALIIVTSDHGEEFGEHGHYLHEQTYVESSHVPLLIKFPGNKHGGRRVAELVQLIDLLPTIAGATDLPLPANLDGQSLLALLDGETQRRDYAYTQRLTMQAVRDTEWSLHQHTVTGASEFFELRTDPGEQNNVISQHEDETKACQAELKEFFAAADGGWRLAFQAGDVPWEPEIALQTTSSFVSSKLLFAHREGISVSEDGKRVGGLLSLKAGERETLIVRTSETDGLSLHVSSKQPFQAHPANSDQPVTSEVHHVLNPGDEQFTRSLTVEAANEPVLIISYTPPVEAGGPPPELSEEQQRALEAIGYAGSPDSRTKENNGGS